jgi:hypothetical protein
MSLLPSTTSRLVQVLTSQQDATHYWFDFNASVRKLKADTKAKYGKFALYQEMAQGGETPEFTALFPSFAVVYEGRLASMFSPSPGTLKHQRLRSKALGSNIFLVSRLSSSFELCNSFQVFFDVSLSAAGAAAEGAGAVRLGSIVMLIIALFDDS